MQGVTQAIEAEIVWSPTHNPRSSSVFTCFVSIVSNLWYMRDHRDVASRAHTVAIRQICQGAKFHLQEPSITSTKHISNRVIVPWKFAQHVLFSSYKLSVYASWNKRIKLFCRMFWSPTVVPFSGKEHHNQWLEQFILLFRLAGSFLESVSSVMVLFGHGHLTGTLHHSLYNRLLELLVLYSLVFMLSIVHVKWSAATPCLCMCGVCVAGRVNSVFPTHFRTFLLCMHNHAPKSNYEGWRCVVTLLHVCHMRILYIPNIAVQL
jgi:hypothetical protein